VPGTGRGAATNTLPPPSPTSLAGASAPVAIVRSSGSSARNRGHIGPGPCVFHNAASRAFQAIGLRREFLSRAGRSRGLRLETHCMMLRNRPVRLQPHPARPVNGLGHLQDEWISVLRWLQANEVEHVLVGPVAEAARGRAGAKGPVAIVPAPYRRNLERLARALWSAHARLRVDTEVGTVPVKLTAEKLANGERFRVRCGSYDLDIESRPPGTPRYQELLYEATRIELQPGLPVEVASPEDLEHFAQARATGRAPEIRITRAQQPA
jgi:hypothetical protein